MVERHRAERRVEQREIGAALVEGAQARPLPAQELFCDAPQRVGFGRVLALALPAPLSRRVATGLGLAQHPGAELAGGRQRQRRAELRSLAGFAVDAVQHRPQRELHAAPAAAVARRVGLHARGLDDQIQSAAAGVGNLAPAGSGPRLGDGERGEASWPWG